LKHFLLISLCCFSLLVRAGDAANSPQPDFSPPPVPDFMLKKPDRPLSQEEMQKQADEAARRAVPPSESRPSTPTQPLAK